MNVITYGFFIYVCLTTIDGISAVSVNSSDTKINPKPKCDLLNIINSKYAGTCEQSNHSIYLCSAIYYTANRICQSITTSNMDVLPKNEKEFDSEISKSLEHDSYVEQFCNQLSEVIRSSQYKSAISSGEAYRNVGELNDRLPTICPTLCLFMKGMKDLKMEVKPLCSVLSWVNQLLVNLAVPENPGNTQVTSEMITSDKAQANEPQPKNMVDSSHSENFNNHPNASLSNNKMSNAGGATIGATVQLAPKTHEVSMANNSKTQHGSNIASTLNNVEEIPVPVTKPQKLEVLDTILPKSKGSGANAPNDNKGLNIININKVIDKPTSDAKSQTSSSPLSVDKTMEASKPGNVDTDQNYDDDGALDGSKDQNYDGDEDPNELLKDTSVQSNLPEPPEIKDLNEKHLRYSPGGMNLEEDESHFFVYFMVLSLVCLMGWVGYHNKKKIMAIVLEGRKSRGERGRRRPNTAGYRKLDCTLEEAVTSQCNSNVTHVIY
ncbi:trans-Golgi network integral membrane protein 2-like isoform X1 [Athalia rosae]|uniref:trans-Golgi network integral membrane protein 2-like isoform X1 n=1 Tax=Athalia rosae TaxID=37344 RepID=UPI0020343504|nr:trans-Golgi network integral membrane protein 2-like isoform X1 [Athalia rosae]XP_025602322.2 trans-Golgi network integral membrane protein 2-like isoform X1 [Athalia rosae]